MNMATSRVFIFHMCSQPDQPAIGPYEEECWVCKEEVPSGITAAALVAVMALS